MSLISVFRSNSTRCSGYSHASTSKFRQPCNNDTNGTMDSFEEKDENDSNLALTFQSQCTTAAEI